MTPSALYDVTFAARWAATGAPLNGIARTIAALGSALLAEPTADVRLTSLGFGDPFVSSTLALEHLEALTRGGRFASPFAAPILRSRIARRIAAAIVRGDAARGNAPARALGRVIRATGRPLTTDLFHTTAYVGPPRGLAGSPRVVRTLYDLIPLSHPELTTAAEHEQARAFVDALRPDDWIVAISEWSADELRARTDFPADRVSVVPLAAAAAFRPRSADAVRVTLDRLGIPAETPFLLALGGTGVRKNLDALFAAVAGLGGSAPPLVVVGAASVPRSGVRFTGPVSDDELSALYSACGAFVFPSRAEGFGLPPLEAMACGAPVIAARGTAVTALVDGAGLLVELEDPEALGRACQRVADDPELRGRLSAAGRERSAEYSWAAAARRTAAAYEGAAG